MRKICLIFFHLGSALIGICMGHKQSSCFIVFSRHMDPNDSMIPQTIYDNTAMVWLKINWCANSCWIQKVLEYPYISICVCIYNQLYIHITYQNSKKITPFSHLARSNCGILASLKDVNNSLQSFLIFTQTIRCISEDPMTATSLQHPTTEHLSSWPCISIKERIIYVTIGGGGGGDLRSLAQDHL